MNHRVQVVVAVVAAVSVWGVLSWRYIHSSVYAQKLCLTIATLVASSDASLGTPGSAGYNYYTVHPEELRAAHRASQATLRDLPCKVVKKDEGS